MFVTYIFPILLFVGLGIIAGLLLAVASTVFAVKSDEKTKAVREALPGINCGVCGFSGCDQYAEKIVKEGERVNRCVPGGEAAAQKISKIMGVSFQGVSSKKAVVHCGGVCGATGRKYEYHGTPTCAACNELYAGSGQCDYGCIGFGDCVKACRYDAIHLVDGVARVDPKKCVGCTMCAMQCPKHLINMVDADATVNVICSSQNSGKETRERCKNGCIACKRCEKTCPHDAIHVEGNLARIDYDKCTRCGECVKVCPVGCIHSFEL